MFAQPNDEVYLDSQNNSISKTTFLKNAENQNALIVKNDSLNIYKAVTERSSKGKINNFSEIASKLIHRHHLSIDTTKPMVIIYHPGKDVCNSSSSATLSWRKQWFEDLESKVAKIAKVKPIYLYRRKEGTEKNSAFLTYYKDPENIVENTFFQFHYPCSSYVIINPDGRYIAYYSEWPKEFLWKNLQELINEK